MPNRRGGGGRGAAAAAAKKKNGAAAGGAGAGDVDKLAASGTGFDDVLDVLNADGGVAGLVKARSAGGFEVKEYGVFGYHKDDGHEVVDEELHEYVVVNPCGASVSSAHNVSGKLYAYLECQGVDLGIVNKHIRSAEKAPACFEYTLKDDKKQSIIYVQSAAMFPSGRRHSVQAEDEYFDKLQAKYSEVFEKAYEGAVIRVPMIGFGAKKGQTEITSQLIKKNVGASQAAFEKFKTSLSVEFCIYDPEHYAMYHDKSEDGSVGSADNGEEDKEDKAGDNEAEDGSDGSVDNSEKKEEEPVGSADEEEDEADEAPVAKTEIRLKKWLVFPTDEPDFGVFVRGFEGDSEVFTQTGTIVHCASRKKIRDDSRNYTLFGEMGKDASDLGNIFKNGFPKDWVYNVSRYYEDHSKRDDAASEMGQDSSDGSDDDHDVSIDVPCGTKRRHDDEDAVDPGDADMIDEELYQELNPADKILQNGLSLKGDCDGDLKIGKNQSINQMQSTRMSKAMLREVYDRVKEINKTKKKISHQAIDHANVKHFLVRQWCTGQLEFDDLYQRMLQLSPDDVQQILEPYMNDPLGGLYGLADERFMVAQDNQPIYEGRHQKGGDYWFVASGQHRFAAVLGVFLGMLPISLTVGDETKVAFFRRPDNRRPGEKYGLAPKSYWGYKNWLDWEKHLNDIVMNEEDGKKKLLLYRDCFKWIKAIQHCSAHKPWNDETSCIMPEDVQEEFLEMPILKGLLIKNMDRLDVYRFFTARETAQKKHTPDMLMCHIYGEVGACIKRVMGYYTLLKNDFIKTLYYRGNIPDADLHCFYSDFVVAMFLGNPGFKIKLLHNVEFSWEERRLDMIKFCQSYEDYENVTEMAERMLKWLVLLGSEELLDWRNKFELNMFRRGSEKQRDCYSVFFFMLLQCDPPSEGFNGFDVSNKMNVFKKILQALQAANRSENPNVAVAKEMQKAASKYHSIWTEWTDDVSEESSEGSARKRARVSE